MQRNYNTYLDKAYPGLLHGLGDATIEKYANTGGLQADMWEIDIPSTLAANTTYSVSIDGAIAQVKYSSTPSQAQVDSDLFVAMRTNPVFSGKAEASLNGPQNKILLVSRQFNIPLVVTVSGVTATRLTSDPVPLGMVPFGRVVVRKPGFDPFQGCLITSGQDQILGISQSTHAIEKFPQYQYGGLQVSYLSGYKPLDVMNVVARTGNITGIWVETIEDDITLEDTPYVSTDPAHIGKITKVPTGIPLADGKFQRPAIHALGKITALLSYNPK